MENFNLRYREKLSLVLRDMNCAIRDKEKVRVMWKLRNYTTFDVLCISHRSANSIDFWLLNRVVVSFSQKPFRESPQANNTLALRVVTARIRYVLSATFYVPEFETRPPFLRGHPNSLMFKKRFQDVEVKLFVLVNILHV